MNPGQMRDWIAGRLDPLDGEDNLREPHGDDWDPPLDQQVDWVGAAVLVPLIEREGGLSVLLTRRADTMRKHKGQVAFPGGRRDPGETAWQTALRESEEEVGLDRGFVSLAGLSTRYRTGTGYVVTPVVGFVQPGFTITPNPDEVADVFETPFEWLMDPLNHELREWEMPDGAKRTYYAMTHDERYIWGATAGMLKALYDRLYGAPVA